MRSLKKRYTTVADLVVPNLVRSGSAPKTELSADSYISHSICFQLLNCRPIVITICRHMQPSADSYNSNLVNCKFHNYRPTF